MLPFRKLPSALALAVTTLVVPGAVSAATSATLTFDFVSDPGDLADGPDYDIVGAGSIDDGGACDVVVIVMTDATGGITDVDTICLNPTSGVGGSDGDYGSFGGYVPVAGPATYALFDIDASDVTALTGLSDNDQAYVDHVVSKGRFLAEGFVDVAGLTSGRRHSFAPGFQCYAAKDLKNPPFTPQDDVPVEDGLQTATADLGKLELVCSPADTDGSGIVDANLHLCCYGAKSTKLSPAAVLDTVSGAGDVQAQLSKPDLFCTACAATAAP